MKTISLPSLEPLETRIAPAVFFLSGTVLTVEDAAGNDAENLPNEIAARTAAGATKAVLLAAGDALVFDEDNDNVRDPQERVLVAVTAGRAMVFLSDGFGPTAGAFDENEISGLAVSDGFKGTINTDVNGAIATTLDATGTFTATTVQGSSITGLKIAGRVLGSVVVGKNLSNVAIGAGLFTTTAEASVESLGAGTGATGTLVKYAFTGATFNLIFNQPDGAPGGSITNVRLENGAAAVRAGNGGIVPTGAGDGAAGGSIVGLVMIDAPGAITVLAGNGGLSANGKGGAGGAIINSSFVFEGDEALESSVQAGSGGTAPRGVSGAGGAIVKTTVHQLGDGLGLAVRGGSGGNGSVAGSVGGAGGAIVASTVITAGSLGVVSGTTLNGGSLTVSGGGGGDGLVKGGVGGAITGSKIQALDSEATVAFFNVSAGSGGSTDDGIGGAGGALSGNTVLATAKIGLTVGSGNLGTASVVAGSGGEGSLAGGAGGVMSRNDVQLLNGVTLTNARQLRIKGGDGGGMEGTGVGGAGGASIDNHVRLGKVGLNTVIAGGDGGDDETVADPGSGGAGGVLTGLRLETIGFLAGLTVSGGAGGAAGTIGKGGAGGAVSGLVTDLRGGGDSGFTIAAGAGGAGGSVQGQGGAGGAFAKATIKVSSINTNILIEAGTSGASRGASSFTGGALSNVVFENAGQIGDLTIQPGAGGDIASGAGVAGGNGALTGVTVTNLGGAGRITIGGGGSADHDGTGNTAKGGDLSSVTVHNLAAAASIDILGTDGEDAGLGGHGGSAGAVRKVTINDPAGVANSVSIEADSGGDGHGPGSLGGAGGNVSDIVLHGPSTEFRIEAGSGDSGVLRGGRGGSISGVRGSVGELRLQAGQGGFSGSGTGGAGGGVSAIDITAVGDFVQRIIAGKGGNGATLGGAGGSIADVRVLGDIGNFDGNFGTGFDALGGLFAGQAGTGGAPLNGSIANVTATRIAAIAAGTPSANAITSANAVHSLTAIKAFVIGADVAADGDFDFTNAGAPGFNFGNGDIALDGLVIARLEAQIHALPVRPLFAATVVASAAPTANLGGTFFLSATALTVEDAAGNSAQNTAAENAAQLATGATRAILMRAGETLIFDENNNHRRDPQERVLVSVTGGSAIVFLSDGFGPTAGAFDENEISGLAVSEKFKATVLTDVNGTIATTLDAAGNFQTSALQKSSIAGLTIAGRVRGIVAAGGNVSGVNIGAGLFTPTAELSVGAIVTGSEANGVPAVYSFSGGLSTLAFAQPDGTSAGSVTKVRLENGAQSIRTGAGGPGAGSGPAGAGGHIVEVVMIDGLGFGAVTAGDGGGAPAGKGGTGGSIVKSTFIYESAFGPARFQAGAGGAGRTGGAGGSISRTTMHQLEDDFALTVAAGDGASSTSGAAPGGAGGSIVGSTIIVAGSLGVVNAGAITGGTLSVTAGDGGDGAAAGRGGSILRSKVQALDSAGAIVTLQIEAGAAGDAAGPAGAAGGSLIGNTIQIHSAIGLDPGTGGVGSLRIRAGTGGASAVMGGLGGAFLNNQVAILGGADVTDGFTDSFVLSAGHGGRVDGIGVGGGGGSFTGNTVRLGEVADAVVVRSGLGGSDGTTGDPGSGGKGGAFGKLVCESFGRLANLAITAGDGGAAGTIGDGGAGGALSEVTVKLGASIGDFFEIRAGNGGQPGSTAGAGGAGGALAKVQAKVIEVGEDVIISAGDARNSRDRAGRNGGSLTGVTFENAGSINDLAIEQGRGAALFSGSGSGGADGAFAKAAITNLGGLDFFFIGSTGAFNHSGAGNGVKGSAFSGVTVHNLAAANFAQITGGAGGNGGTGGGNGGAGASVSKIVFHDPAGMTGTVNISASHIGNGTGPAGRGTASGSLSDVTLDGPGTVFVLRAGGGGDAAAGGGKGGSISKIRGSVGALQVQAGDGGNAATGLGGGGGSVADVNITAVGDFVRHIIAGNGGNSGTLGGNGGSLMKIAVAGDLGDFDTNFGADDNEQGGLFAGQAGTGGAAQNGSITNVTATRIAAILAGRPAANAITAANAVFNLTGIGTNILGADVNADGVFAFTNAGVTGFNLGDGDTALDGLVVTRRAAHLAALPVAPLFSSSIVP